MLMLLDHTITSCITSFTLSPVPMTCVVISSLGQPWQLGVPMEHPPPPRHIPSGKHKGAVLIYRDREAKNVQAKGQDEIMTSGKNPSTGSG